ncbi:MULTISPECIES: hypothetical protein [Burkholderia cepacia complex]|uniref:hypothetical protein n=1 Tax=Burkholderia cepacia complex TaxID=87882 RepID=UPI0013DE022E|nr:MULTISPECIES: hypothetical protein [Burkholderia cepacia complex]
MANLKPEHIANLINEMYYDTFAGKTRGRFFLTKDQIKALAGRSQMQTSVIESIAKFALKNHGLCMAEVDAGYGFIEQDKVSAWRAVPARKLNTYAKTGQREHEAGGA